MSLQNNRKYNVTIILDSRGYDQPVETIQQKVSGLMQELGASVESFENLGRRDVTRIIDKSHAGDTYLSVTVSGPASLPADFHERVRLDRLIKRTMFKSA